MLDKSVIIYATESFVREAEDLEEGEAIDESNEIVTYLVPIAEKRLDYSIHKVVEAIVEETEYLIQDAIIQVDYINEEREIRMTTVSVVSEDVATREYWDSGKQEFVNTQESMLTINFALVNTKTE